MIAVRWTNDNLDIYDTELEFREQMAFRALNWSGTTIDPTGTPAEFFAELERARMIVIEGCGGGRVGDLSRFRRHTRQLYIGEISVIRPTQGMLRP